MPNIKKNTSFFLYILFVFPYSETQDGKIYTTHKMRMLQKDILQHPHYSISSTFYPVRVSICSLLLRETPVYGNTAGCSASGASAPPRAPAAPARGARRCPPGAPPCQR